MMSDLRSHELVFFLFAVAIAVHTALGYGFAKRFAFARTIAITHLVALSVGGLFFVATGAFR